MSVEHAPAIEIREIVTQGGEKGSGLEIYSSGTVRYALVRRSTRRRYIRPRLQLVARTDECALAHGEVSQTVFAHFL